MDEPKKKRVRIKESHRWTESETKVLLQKIQEAISDNPSKFEKPTAQHFYKIQCKDPILDGIEWKMMRGKMRYLKSTYIKAIQWRDQVGSELFQSDKAHVEGRIKSICPYYSQLNAILEPMLPADPIRLTDRDFKNRLSTETTFAENDSSTDNSDLNESEFGSVQNDSLIVIPKIETEPDDHPLAFDESSIRPTMKRKANVFQINQTNDDFLEDNIEQDHEEESSLFYKTQLELDCAKFHIERKKFLLDLQSRKDKKILSRLQLNFEKEKFEFEKRKVLEDQRLRRYEIDKQFEMKKLEIEKEERIRRLELECKYRYKPNDEIINCNDKSNYI